MKNKEPMGDSPISHLFSSKHLSYFCKLGMHAYANRIFQLQELHRRYTPLSITNSFISSPKTYSSLSNPNNNPSFTVYRCPSLKTAFASMNTAPCKRSGTEVNKFLSEFE